MPENAHPYYPKDLVLHKAPVENSFKSLFYLDVELEFGRQFSGAASSLT